MRNLIISLVLLYLVSPSSVNSQVGLLGSRNGFVQVVAPNEFYQGNIDEDVKKKSNVIDGKYFIESHKERCLSTTIIEDLYKYEPSFVFIKPNADIRRFASSNLKLMFDSGLIIHPKARTYIFVHGFTQSYPKTEWLTNVTKLFRLNLHASQHNAIIMDWSEGAGQNYNKAAAITSVMGAYLASFIQKLIDLGIDPLSIHLIGHSLGAHITGYAGKRIRPKIGRLTALDPAGPCFSKVVTNGKRDRVTEQDALQVDVYHYDDGFLGFGEKQVGQIDVFVNGGSDQPGCRGQVDTMFNAVVTVALRRANHLSESHTRSTEVATVLMADSKCHFIAYKCRSYAAFTHGECGRCDHQSDCFNIGFHFQYREMNPEPLRETKTPSRYYIRTGEKENFCLFHYQIILKLEQTPEIKRKDLKFSVDLFNDQGGQANVIVKHRASLNSFTYLLLINAQPTKIVGAQVRALDEDDKSIPLSGSNGSSSISGQAPIQVLGLEVNFMSNMNQNIRNAFSSRLCVGNINGLNIESSNLISGSANGKEINLAECQGVRGSLM